ncbi:hypothetical protein [Pseudonocardia sp. GCM10023141]|uniref:hypothetical protein n=1 Tax=Pseudonocardia sp. GCM10023141 TaxID=3252653 RepID=UPI003621B1ED
MRDETTFDLGDDVGQWEQLAGDEPVETPSAVMVISGIRDSTVSSRPVPETPRCASARMTWSSRAMPS